MKFQGCGNDFVLIDNRSSSAPVLSIEQCMAMCDRHFGIGADGIIFLLPPNNDECAHTMLVVNSDGSETPMCGNGIRCFAKFIQGLDPESGPVYTISTGAGKKIATILSNGEVAVNMGPPALTRGEIPTEIESSNTADQCIGSVVEVLDHHVVTTCVNMGNPHTVSHYLHLFRSLIFLVIFLFVNIFISGCFC